MGVPEVGETPAAAASTERRVPWLAIGLGVALVLAALIALGLVGELGSFLGAGLNVLPFVGLAILAALGERHRWARWLAYIYLLVLVFAILGMTALFVFVGALGPNLTTPNFGSPDTLLTAGRLGAVYLGVGLVLLVIALLPLAPAVRHQVARWLPIRPDSVMSTTGLCTVLALGLLPLAGLAVLGGQPPLLSMINSLSTSDAVLVRQQDQLYGLVWMLPASLVLVGYPLRRRFGEALVRLGLVWPSARQVMLGLAVAVGLVLLATALDYGISSLWSAFGWPRTDAHAFEKLMAGLITPVGAVVIGVSAGLGEELAVRGVLQPRVGIVLANLAFTAIHAYQYSWDALLSVFLVGLVLGVLRSRTNTTTAAITHGTYDFILVMAAALGIGS
jgi:hypothetical protein